MPETIQIGWYNPGSHRFCYTDEKEARPDNHTAYTVPVYIFRDDPLTKAHLCIDDLEGLLEEARQSLSRHVSPPNAQADKMLIKLDDKLIELQKAREAVQ